MSQHGGQAATGGFHAARAHAFQLDAVFIKVDDVRAVFVRYPECAVLHHGQAFAVDAVDVALKRVFVRIHHLFFGCAVACGVGQAGERFALCVFQGDGAQFSDAAVALDFKMADAGGEARLQEDFDVFAAVGIGAAVG